MKTATMATRPDHAKVMEFCVVEHLAPDLVSELAALRKIACVGVVEGNVAAIDCRILDDEGYFLPNPPCLTSASFEAAFILIIPFNITLLAVTLYSGTRSIHKPTIGMIRRDTVAMAFTFLGSTDA